MLSCGYVEAGRPCTVMVWWPFPPSASPREKQAFWITRDYIGVLEGCDGGRPLEPQSELKAHECRRDAIQACAPHRGSSGPAPFFRLPRGRSNQTNGFLASVWNPDSLLTRGTVLGNAPLRFVGEAASPEQSKARPSHFFKICQVAEAPAVKTHPGGCQGFPSPVDETPTMALSVLLHPPPTKCAADVRRPAQPPDTSHTHTITENNMAFC